MTWLLVNEEIRDGGCKAETNIKYIKQQGGKGMTRENIETPMEQADLSLSELTFVRHTVCNI
jgi:hypothetical protein